MICENCGAELGDSDQSFCPNCGKMDSNKILLFVDPKRYRIWMWHGKNASTRSKFIAAKQAPSIRDKYGPDFKIVAVDEGNEPSGFWSLINEN